MKILQPLLPAPRLSQPPRQLFLIPAAGTRGELCPVGRQLAAPAGSEADLAELFLLKQPRNVLTGPPFAQLRTQNCHGNKAQAAVAQGCMIRTLGMSAKNAPGRLSFPSRHFVFLLSYRGSMKNHPICSIYTPISCYSLPWRELQIADAACTL